jgi:hypothetical protein
MGIGTVIKEFVKPVRYRIYSLEPANGMDGEMVKTVKQEFESHEYNFALECLGRYNLKSKKEYRMERV